MTDLKELEFFDFMKNVSLLIESLFVCSTGINEFLDEDGNIVGEFRVVNVQRKNVLYVISCEHIRCSLQLRLYTCITFVHHLNSSDEFVTVSYWLLKAVVATLV